MPTSRLHRMATLLHGVTLACEIALPILLALALFRASAREALTWIPDGADPRGAFLLLGTAAGLAPALALIWALDILRRLFARYRDGEVLTEASARLIRQTGKAFLVLAVLKIASQPLQSLLFTWQSPPGSRMVSLSLGQAEIGFLLLAGLLTLIGWATTEAAQAVDENRAFV